MYSSCIYFWETAQLLCRMAVSLRIPSTMSDPFSASIPAFGIVIIFQSSHSDKCVVISHFGFLCIFLMTNEWQWKSFTVLICPLYIIFNGICLHFLDHSNGIVRYFTFECWEFFMFNIFKIPVLCQICAWQIFFPILELLFILVIGQSKL